MLVGGVVVSRATLHNIGRAFAWYMYSPTPTTTPTTSELPCVVIERSGDVIPHIVGREDGRVRPPPPPDADADDDDVALF